MRKLKWMTGLATLAFVSVMVVFGPKEQAQKAIDNALLAWSFPGREQVAKINVPRLDIGFSVLRGHAGEVLAAAPGWHENTAFPGSPGLSVISGYSDIDFSFLRDLQDGDQLEMKLRDGTHKTYRVSKVSFTQDPNVTMPIATDRNTLLLMTSYPFANWQPEDTMFFLVVAKEVSGETV